MENESVKIIWIIFWILLGMGWSVLSFHWLRKSVEAFQPLPEGQKSPFKALILRRIVMFVLFGLLLYFALRTEPVGAIGMVVVITIATWVQVIVYNSRLEKPTGRKEN